MRCPLCDEKIEADPCCTWFCDDDASGMWLHFQRSHMTDEQLTVSLQCVCGFRATPDEGDIMLMGFLIRDHLVKLTPEQHQQHVVLYQMGARFHD